MAQARKTTGNRGRGTGQDKIRAELTSSQAMVGVVILILFGLACFLVGVLVGKFQAAQPAAQIALAEPTPPPRTVVLPRPEPEPSPPEPIAETEPEPTPAPEPEPIPVNTSPPDPEPEPIPDPVEVAPTPEPVISEPPVESTPSPPPPEPVSQPRPSQPVEALEPEMDVIELPISTPSAEPALGQYTVQIGAFSKVSLAGQAKQRIESNTSLDVYLVDSPARNLVIVHAGSFPTKEKAEIARAELKTKLGYQDCYVTEHSIALTKAGM